MHSGCALIFSRDLLTLSSPLGSSEEELVLGQATNTYYCPCPHSILVLQENRLVTIADLQWHRLGRPQGTGVDSRASNEKDKASAFMK